MTTITTTDVAAAPEPPPDCPLCPRLVAFRHENAALYPAFHNAPVPSWVGEEGRERVRLLVVGMAPGLKGANRTGRPFTGDYAGDLLFATLKKHGFASGTYRAEPDDGMVLHDCAITNAVRCVPPQNKPTGPEANSCRPFLRATLATMPALRVAVTLGKIAHDSFLRGLGERVAAHPFGHDREHATEGLTVVSSYHCSRYNTNTGVLTPQMFDAVFARVRRLLDG